MTEAKLEVGKVETRLRNEGKTREEIAQNPEYLALKQDLNDKQQTFDNAYGTGSKTKRAVEAAATGAGSEAAADFIVQTLYDGKSTKELSESEKQTVTFLSQLAGGLASGIIGDSTQSAAVGADIGKRAVENNALGLKDIALYERYLMRAIANGESTEAVHEAFKALSEKQRADELTGGLEGALKDWFGKLSGEEQTRFYKIVEEENQKTIAVLEAKQNGFEKAVDVALVSASVFSKENALESKGQSIQSNLAKKVHKTGGNEKGSALPVPSPKKSNKNGETYTSNAKHTLGQSGRSDPNAGIEPRNSFQLFEESKVLGKQRFTIDDQGNIHRFMNSNTSEGWHWADSTSDINNPLKLNNKQKSELQKIFPEHKKNPYLK